MFIKIQDQFIKTVENVNRYDFEVDKPLKYWSRSIIVEFNHKSFLNFKFYSEKQFNEELKRLSNFLLVNDNSITLEDLPNKELSKEELDSKMQDNY